MSASRGHNNLKALCLWPQDALCCSQRRNIVTSVRPGAKSLVLRANDFRDGPRVVRGQRRDTQPRERGLRAHVLREGVEYGHARREGSRVGGVEDAAIVCCGVIRIEGTPPEWGIIPRACNPRDCKQRAGLNDEVARKDEAVERRLIRFGDGAKNQRRGPCTVPDTDNLFERLNSGKNGRGLEVAGQLRNDSRVGGVLDVRRIGGSRTQTDAHQVDGK